MQLRNSTLVWSAVGLLAVGTATGYPPWRAAARRSGRNRAPRATRISPRASQPIPPMTAPNYRAIVARNQAAVVGITTAGSDPHGRAAGVSLRRSERR